MKTAEFENNTLTISTANGGQTITVGSIAHNWNAVSHTPDRAARIRLSDLAAYLNNFADYVRKVAANGGDVNADDEIARYTEKCVSLARNAWAADGRCMSSFIVGPANFPTRRAEKRNQASMNAYTRIDEHAKAARKAVKRRAWPHGAPGEAVRGSDPDAIAKLKAKLADMERQQDLMKQANAAIRKHRKGGHEAMLAAVMPLCRSEQVARELLKPNYLGKIGFEPWQLSNNNANMRRVRDRIAMLEARQSKGTQESEIETAAGGTVSIVENVEADRVQLVFPGKPDPDTHATLKSHGFRWSPRNGAWQRHLNQNGRDAAKAVLAALA